MIPFNFDYYRPDTIREAVDTYFTLQSAGKRPYYYGGGTEIISMARVNDIQPDAVIDIKYIPECRDYGPDNGTLHFGAGVTLSAITESDLFPLLTKACGRVADHSVQVKVTLGGNLCGTIIYREGLLPLLLAGATITIAGKDGLKTCPIYDRLNNGARLADGELLARVSLDKTCADRRYWHIKRVAAEKIGYPLITAAALENGGKIRLAFSGLCAFPFLAAFDLHMDPEEMMRNLPASILNNTEGSAQYRKSVCRNTVQSILKEAGG